MKKTLVSIVLLSFVTISILSFGNEITSIPTKDTHTADSELFDSFDFSTFLTITINGSAEKVWRYTAGDKRNWGPLHRFYTVSGEVGAEGEIFKSLSVDVNGIEQPYPILRYKIVKLMPFTHAVIKIYKQESREDEERFIAYNVALMSEENGKTKLTFIQTVKLSREQFNDHELITKKQEADVFLRNIFQELKEVIEKD